MNTQNTPLIAALERILSYFQENHSTFAQSLQPGLTREQIEAQVQALPFRLPEEVYQLYQWRNGSSGEVLVEFLPEYRMLSLEEAISQRQLSYGIYLEVCGDLAEDDGCWLPLFAEDGNFYVVKGDTESQATAPIFHRFYIECELELTFNNLTNMMQAIAECFEAGVYYFENREYNYIYWDIDDPREAQIWLKYQPYQNNNVTAILNNQTQHLSSKELIQAYSDLVETKHPQALSVLSQALKNSNLTDSSLRFHLINDICRLNNTEALQYLLNLLKQGNSDIQYTLIDSLVRVVPNKELIRDSEAADVIIQILQKGGGSENVIKLSGILGDTKAVEPLLAILQREVYGSSDPNDQGIPTLDFIVWLNTETYNLGVLLAVIEALGILNDGRAIEPLFRVAILAQQCESQTICLVAARALRRLGDFRAREILTQLANSEHAAIRDWVRVELEQMA